MKSIQERLEEKLTHEPNTGCILWIGSSDKDGYGKIFYNKRHRRTHCVVYELTNGPIPKGHLIQHSCDNPGCCNIIHLSLGTPLTNMRDKVKKGRLMNQYTNATHCKHGHEFNYINTKNYGGKRACCLCIAKRYGYKKTTSITSLNYLDPRWPVT